MLCRGGVTFVNKMDQFIWGAQSVDNTPSDLNSKYSVRDGPLENLWGGAGEVQKNIRAREN